MKKKIAWFASKNDTSVSALFSERLLKELNKDYSVDCFGLDNRQNFHHLRYSQLNKASKYYCNISLLEDNNQSSFTLRTIKTLPCISLFLDTNFIDNSFSELSQASVGRVFDDFSYQILKHKKFQFGKFRDRKWNLEIFKRFLTNFKEHNKDSIVAACSFDDYSFNSLDFPLISRPISRTYSTKVTLGISPQNFLNERIVLALKVVSKLSNSFDIELIWFSETAEQHEKAINYSKNFRISVTHKMIDKANSLFDEVSRCSLFWSLNSRKDKVPCLASIFALEANIPSLIYRDSHISSFVKNLPLIRAGIDERSEILKTFAYLIKYNKEFSDAMELTSTVDSAYQSLINLINVYNQDKKNEIEVQESLVNKARENLINSVAGSDEYLLIQEATKDFTW